MTSSAAILKVSALISGKDFLHFFSSGKLASCDLHFTGVRKTTWLQARLSFLCQNTIFNPPYRVIGMSKDLLDYPFCHDVNKYEKMVKIGQGTFGFVDCFSPPFWKFCLSCRYVQRHWLLELFCSEVFKARNRKNLKEIVALKKVLMDNEKEGVFNVLVNTCFALC